MLELGGSDPFIVLDADDLGATVKAATMGRMQNTGQACTAAKRLIVTEELYDDFVAGLQQSFATFTPGDPADPSTSLAPLSSRAGGQGPARPDPGRHRQGRDRRRRRHAPRPAGAFVEATILTDVTPEMRAYREELFGPAAVVYKVQDEEEAVALANDSDYGLGAAVFCGDLDRARAVADGSRPAWSGSTSPRPPSPSCPSAA